MNKYSVIIFDWDGTLMDSTHSIVQAIQGACRDLELRVPTAAQAAWVIGLSLEPALRRAVAKRRELLGDDTGETPLIKRFGDDEGLGTLHHLDTHE